MTAARAVPPPLRRGAYFLPSLFTIGNIFLGFFAIVLALQGRFGRAGFCILLAAVLDFLDGKIARMTGTESEFGREFDSLADVLTFGMSPALCAWAWGLHELERAGWLVPLFYVVATATRLARYNVQATRIDSRWFVGLPSPAAAGTIASFLLVGVARDWRPWMNGAMAAMLVALGLLMVSTFRYWSLKSLDFRQPRSYRMALPIAAVILLLAFWPELFFPGFAVTYAASGPLAWLFGRLTTPRRALPPADSATRRLPPEES
jgi:CDP-diacylglycerol--serine O-phosphatidyltransferase